MVRLLVVLLALIAGLYLSIQVFGWIVSGDIGVRSFSLKREERPGRFWLAILGFGALSFGVLMAAIAVYGGLLF